jgi:hypothetical protein
VLKQKARSARFRPGLASVDDANVHLVCPTRQILSKMAQNQLGRLNRFYKHCCIKEKTRCRSRGAGFMIVARIDMRLICPTGQT